MAWREGLCTSEALHLFIRLARFSSQSVRPGLLSKSTYDNAKTGEFLVKVLDYTYIKYTEFTHYNSVSATSQQV